MSEVPLYLLIVSGSQDHLVKIWDAETRAEVRSFVGRRWGEKLRERRLAWKQLIEMEQAYA